MTKSLESIKNELAVQEHDDLVKRRHVYSSEYEDTAIFKRGFDAAIKALTEMGAPEFDEECIELSKWIGEFDNGITAPTYGDVARWQHSQNAAQILALKVEVEEWQRQYSNGLAFLQEKENELAALLLTAENYQKELTALKEKVRELEGKHKFCLQLHHDRMLRLEELYKTIGEQTALLRECLQKMSTSSDMYYNNNPLIKKLKAAIGKGDK